MLLIILFSLMINIAEQILIYNLFCQSVAHEANATNKSAYSLIDPRFHLRKFVVALSLWVLNQFELLHAAQKLPK